MTDRFAGYVVTLEQNLRDDDAEATTNAIRQIKGVADVQAVISTPEKQLAEMRARTKLIDQLWNVFKGT